MGNVLDVVLIIKSDKNLSLVDPFPPSLTKIIFPINYLGGGGPTYRLPCHTFWLPGSTSKADVMHKPCIGVAGVLLLLNGHTRVRKVSLES